jgi:hypothetical protein
MDNTSLLLLILTDQANFYEITLVEACAAFSLVLILGVDAGRCA